MKPKPEIQFKAKKLLHPLSSYESDEQCPDYKTKEIKRLVLDHTDWSWKRDLDCKTREELYAERPIQTERYGQ